MEIEAPRCKMLSANFESRINAKWRSDLQVNDGVLLLGHLAHVLGDPFADSKALEIQEKGAIYIDSTGRIGSYGSAEALKTAFPKAQIRDFGSAWILPGFVDGHIHFPQMEAIASEAGTLMDWLEKKIFPAECALEDPVFAATLAQRFVERLLASGTTTAMVFGSQFLAANRHLFASAERHGLNLMAGMTMMDQGGPTKLLRSPTAAYDQVKTLAEEVREKPGLTYVITPRFALSTSPEMLDVCQALVAELPDCPVQTHINESPGEIAAVGAMFPQARDYLSVYEKADLIQQRTVLAHNIHPTEGELARIADRGAAVCHCPNSNLFLGSGLFPLQRHLDLGIPVLMGTDIGAGLRFCLLDELSEAYKVQKIQGLFLNAAKLLYLATLGAQKALGRDRHWGNFAQGKQADLVVLQPARDPDLARRIQAADHGEAALFALIMMGGRHIVEETLVAGQIRYRNRATGY